MGSKDNWQEELARIAVDELRLDIFDYRGNDDLDEHTLTLQRLRRALKAAYRAGIAGGLQHVRVGDLEGRKSRQQR